MSRHQRLEWGETYEMCDGEERHVTAIYAAIRAIDSAGRPEAEYTIRHVSESHTSGWYSRRHSTEAHKSSLYDDYEVVEPLESFRAALADEPTDKPWWDDTEYIGEVVEDYLEDRVGVRLASGDHVYMQEGTEPGEVRVEEVEAPTGTTHRLVRPVME